MFFGRHRQIAHVVNRDLTNYIIVGGRQLGKTSLLREIERRFADNPAIACTYLSLSGEDVVRPIGHALGLPADANLDALVRALEDAGDADRRLILIDEADLFVGKEEESGFRALHQFRRLKEEGKCFFILAGFWSLYRSAIFDYQSPILNFGEVLQVGGLEPEACLALLTEPMQALNVDYETPDLPQRIVQECGGRENLPAITCAEIINGLDLESRVIRKDDVDRALSSKGIWQALSGWESLSGVEDIRPNTLDRLIVYATIAPGRFSLEDIIRLIEQHGLAFFLDEIKEALERLQLAYIIQQSGSEYRYLVPLFAKLVQQADPEIQLGRTIRDFTDRAPASGG